MRKKSRFLTQAALLCALYTALCYVQNLLLPGSATWAIQFRVAEALCVLALFTPAAMAGLPLGCLLFGISFAPALPLDLVLGPLASFLAAAGMYLSRKCTLRGFPLLPLLLPGLCNGLLVGWALSVYAGGGFWLNALSVAAGEAAVLLTLGSLLYYAIRLRKLAPRLFA